MSFGVRALTLLTVVTAALAAASAQSAARAGSVIPLAPFTECPSVGASPSCEILLMVEPSGSITVYHDSSVGPYDGGDDTLVGIYNNSGKPISAVTVTGQGTGLGGFDGDGLCTYNSCSWPNPTTYEGPDNTFVTSSALPDSAEVDFTTPLAQSATTYFSLEGDLSSAMVTARQGALQGLQVTPTSGLPGQQFSATWNCTGGNGSITITNAAGQQVLGSQLPVTGNGVDYVDGFQAALPVGTYTVTAFCGSAALTPVTITITGASYVSLGDSFSSGEGAKTFFPGTDVQGTDTCDRAVNGYAVRLASKLGYTLGSTFDFAACSGAQIPDLYSANSGNYTEIAQDLHLSPAAKLVTISIGGNDIGFRPVLTDCLSLAPIAKFFVHTGGSGCASRDASAMATAITWLANGRKAGCYKLPGIDQSTGKPDTVCGSLPSLTQVYADIHKAAPNAKILVLGYPRFWGTTYNFGYDSCEVLNFHGSEGLVSAGDMAWMNSVALSLNTQIQRAATLAAAKTGTSISYVDVDSAFSGHRLCDKSSPWFNRLIVHIPGNPQVDSRSFHPNDAGQSQGFFPAISKLA